jgi:hypothetical protein
MKRESTSLPVNPILLHRSVVVLWHDSCVTSGWVTPKTAKVTAPIFVVSQGLVIKEDEACITLMQSYVTDDDVCNSVTIPRSIVDAIDVIDSPIIEEHPYESSGKP